jgi:hypothetical protein
MSNANRAIDPLIILHISDLHFGWDVDVKANDERELALNGLLRKLATIDADWKPNCVCLTGDIGWRGAKDDYVQAALWIEKLLGILEIEKEALFLCAGNHDLDRSLARQNVRPHNSSEADRVLRIPVPKHYEDPFNEFTIFCRQMNCPPLMLGDTPNYLVGTREFRGVSFIALNSAWFSQDEHDKGNLWLGLPLLKHLECSHQLSASETLHDGPICVALLHHPKEYLSEAEFRAEDYGRQNTFDYLARRCHLILTGHTHGEVRRADRTAEAAWNLSGGAAYAGASHFNSFRLVRLENERLVYRSFEYDPRSADNLWHPKDQATALTFVVGPRDSQAAQISTDHSLRESYRHNTSAAALKLIIAKSRALKPEGQLPRTSTVDVLASSTGVRPHFTNHKEFIIQPRNQIRVPLQAAVNKGRRTLLLGDLGTGKSTMVATLVNQIQEENQKGLALIAPAKELHFNDQLTVKELFEIVSNYFSSQIAPASEPLSLEMLLKLDWEITLIVDGLDELTHYRAATLLSRLGDAVDHWPTIRVIATARPVELHGVSFEDWNVFSMAPLSDDEKLRFFEEEAKAEGHEQAEATEIARRLMAALRKQPRLSSLANTPLIVRLLYSKLSRDERGRPETLGDILTEVVNNRLGDWGTKDRKPALTVFEREFPDANSRGGLLGQLALLFAQRDSISVDEAKNHLRDLVSKYSNENPLVLSNEALEFFGRAGLITISDLIRFTIQPLYEVVSAFGLASLWKTDRNRFPVIESDRWRVMSFFSAHLRRDSALESAKPLIKSFLAQLMTSDDGASAAAYVVTESQDEELGRCFVENLNKLGSHPIRFFVEEQTQSARAIAESLKLAGQIGFDWFYGRYLNPRYPAIRFGSMAVEQVFKQWAVLSLGNLEDRERQLLISVVRPHIQAGSSYLLSIIPILSILTPEAFSAEERLWFAGKFLDDDSEFSRIAEGVLRSEFERGNDGPVSDALLKHAQQGYENSASAAHLWLKLNPGRPPIVVIRALIKFVGYLSGYPNLDAGIDEVVNRLGDAAWRVFLRFYVTDNDHYLSAGAAVLLNRLGETSIDLLGTPLLNGIHDGIRARRAEEVLDQLVPNTGNGVLNWLANKIGSQHDDFMDSGAPSGWWRPFLARLENIGRTGPRLLAQAIGGIGCFLFARRPEVRQMLRDLLEGPYGLDYRQALSEKLTDLNPKVRHGAAMTLVVCDPQNQSHALEIVVKYSNRESSWYEWRQFCLTLCFGPSVLAYLESKLPSLPTSARVFALAILFRNGRLLSDSDNEALTKGLCDWRNYGLDADDPQLAFVSKPVALPHLLHVLEEDLSKESEKAAGFLLAHHANRLTSLQFAKCSIINFSKLTPWSTGLKDQVEKLRLDSSYAQIVEQASNEHAGRKGKRPTLDLLREGLTQPNAWRQLVWQTICDDSEIKTDNEDAGQWFLDFGRETPAAGRQIGSACREFLGERRACRWDSQQWLCVLADEFVGLPTDDLQAALNANPGSHHSTVSALIARIGNQPSSYKGRQSVGSLPTQSLTEAPAPRTELLEQLRDQTRDSTKVHPKLCDTLEKFLYQAPLSEVEIALLLQNGNQGALAAISLAVVFNHPVKPNVYLNLFPIARTKEDRCFEHLFQLCSLGRQEMVKDEAVRTEYLKELDEYLATSAGDLSFIAREILSIRGGLNEKQGQIVLNNYATNLSPYDFELGDLLVSWLAGDLGATEAHAAIEALKRGIDILNNYAWEKSELDDAFRFLFFPIAYWKLGASNDDPSSAVFLRGLKFIFSKRMDDLQTSYSHNAVRRIAPLVSGVPVALLNEVIDLGRQSTDPIVKSLCHVFSFQPR